MQVDLESIYKRAKENQIPLNANKFEKIVHGYTKNTEVESYDSQSGDPIIIKNTVNTRKYSQLTS